MRLRAEIEIGPLLIVFDPWPADDADDEPTIQATTAAQTDSERREDYGNPELHVGFRSGNYEDSDGRR